MIKTRLIKLLSHARKYIAQQILWQWLGLICQVVIIFQVTGLIEELAYGIVYLADLISALIVVVVAVLLRMLFDRLNVKASYKASLDVKRILREQIYSKVLRLGAAYRDSVSTADILQMSVDGVEQLETYFGRYLSQLFYSLLAPLTLFFILRPICPGASVALLICVPLIPMSIVLVQKIAKRLLGKYWGAYAALGDSFLESLQGLTTLKIYRADEKRAEELDKESEHFRRITMKVLTMQLNSTSVMDIMAYGGAAVGMIVVLKNFFAGNVSLQGTLAICLLASEFFIPLRILGSYFHIAMNGMAASDRIFALLDLPEAEKGKQDLPAFNANPDATASANPGDSEQAFPAASASTNDAEQILQAASANPDDSEHDLQTASVSPNDAEQTLQAASANPDDSEHDLQTASVSTNDAEQTLQAASATLGNAAAPDLPAFNANPAATASASPRNASDSDIPAASASPQLHSAGDNAAQLRPSGDESREETTASGAASATVNASPDDASDSDIPAASASPQLHSAGDNAAQLRPSGDESREETTASGAASATATESPKLINADADYAAPAAADGLNIELRDLSFSYDGEREILKNINMEFPAGRLTAIVGPSGCGKSTIAGILTGRNPGFSGSAAIAGIELGDIAEASLMNAVTRVSTGSFIFKGTAEDNLLMGKPDASKAEMEDALRRVNLLDFLNARDGLDTVILEGGANLSGGQRQRLALARALLHDSPVYIFDEATSNIDVESEEQIMKVIYELAGSRTVILISHRLANVTAADRIYVLGNGAIAEEGTHEELLAAGGAYAELYLSQKELESCCTGEASAAESAFSEKQPAAKAGHHSLASDPASTEKQPAAASGHVTASVEAGHVSSAASAASTEEQPVSDSAPNGKQPASGFASTKKNPAGDPASNAKHSAAKVSQPSLAADPASTEKQPAAASGHVTASVEAGHVSSAASAASTEEQPVSDSAPNGKQPASGFASTEKNPAAESGHHTPAAKRRSGAAIMMRLIKLIKPLVPVILLAIFLGVIGYLCAIFLTITAGYGILSGFSLRQAGGALFALLIIMAVARGLLHYGEQYCNHYIAFTLLAIIRHKIFAKLRELAPAKLEGRDKGNLISVITSDIELLEVFYAHTISPIAIAFAVSIVMVIFIGTHSAAAALLALLAYITVGVLIPLYYGRRGGDAGMEYRQEFGDLNSYVLESLRGVDESIQYAAGGKRGAEMSARSDSLGTKLKPLNNLEARQRSITNLAVQLFSFAMLVLMIYQWAEGPAEFADVLICVISMMGSFGPVIALASLSNNLSQTLASGERVLSLLEEQPETAEVTNGIDTEFASAAAKHVYFTYSQKSDPSGSTTGTETNFESSTEADPKRNSRLSTTATETGDGLSTAVIESSIGSSPESDSEPNSETGTGSGAGVDSERNSGFSTANTETNTCSNTIGTETNTGLSTAVIETSIGSSPESDSGMILTDYSLDIEKEKITGIHGASGSGKSTLLRLFMRFWDVSGGSIEISGTDIRNINTKSLRAMQSFVTQETSIFHSSIADNIAIGKPDASREEIVEAAKKAALHDFVMTLPHGYDTMAGELGDTLSGGERQRIGLARAFLCDALLMLLDEPTSNLDSLNEAIVLKSIADNRAGRTVILVSHRLSTLGICDSISEM